MLNRRLMYVAMLALVSCSSPQSDLAELADTKTTVMDWLPNEVYVTASEVEKIYSVDIGRVIVRRTGDGRFFSIMVIPYREIHPGTNVEVAEVTYKLHPASFNSFLVTTAE